MAKKISNKNKFKRKMGTGEGANYKPFITTSEFNSIGTTTVIRAWKTGRGIHCLSQGEMYWYYLLRWDDNNIDIREQYPLNREETLAIADKLGVKHPGNNDYIMTTDFLVTKSDNTFHAYSIKTAKDSLNDRDLEILCIEKMYWKSKNIKYSLLFKTDANIIMVQRFIYEEEKLGAWVDTQKKRYKVEKLSRKRIDKLLELDKDFFTTTK